jgi:hypothetical protein
MRDRKEYQRKWYQSHKEEEREKQKKYRISHADVIESHNKSSVRKQYMTKYQRKYIKLRRQTDVNFYLKDRLRARLSKALNRNQKTGSAVKDLGCSISELKKYLESRFQPGMTWDNRGKKWHIDHVIPLIKFNLQDHQQFLIANHYTNLQPLWATENIVKNDFSVEDFREGVF